jgi:hypothetical protein
MGWAFMSWLDGDKAVSDPLAVWLGNSTFSISQLSAWSPQT